MATSIVTNTPYSPGADTSLMTFGNGNELVAETVTFANDANGLGFDVTIATNPAGLGQDMADTSVGLQFANLYFGNSVTSYLGLEATNSRAFIPGGLFGGTQPYLDYTAASSGITFTDTPGTLYADGGQGSVFSLYVPYAAYESLAAAAGVTVVAGDTIELRDIQAFSYAGNNAGGDPRFGTITIPSVPEPGVWALMVVGLGFTGVMLRRRRAALVAA